MPHDAPQLPHAVAHEAQTEFQLHTDPNDLLLGVLRRFIHGSVRVLSVLMTFVILWGVLDVAYVLYQRLNTPPYFLLEITDILKTFGAFMAVLIAIEIFVNITVYLRDDVIHIKIVLATALMAIARQVIVLNTKEVSAAYVTALASVFLAVSIGYWLIVVHGLRKRAMQARTEPPRPG